MSKYCVKWCWLLAAHLLFAYPVWAELDGPDTRKAGSVRAVHFVLASSGRNAQALDYSKAMHLISEASRTGFNTAIIQIANGVVFNSATQLVRPGAWTKQEFIDLVKMANSKGIEVIPEIKLLTHQEKLFQTHFPRLMFNQTTYDPNQKATYEVVFALLNEIIDAVKPKAIHIGHDEVSSQKSKKNG